MRDETKSDVLKRLNFIDGHLDGIRRMVEADKYCVDVLMQIAAIQGALEQVSKIVMTRHIESCVVDSLRPGSERERARKIEELFRVFSRHSGFGAR